MQICSLAPSRHQICQLWQIIWQIFSLAPSPGSFRFLVFIWQHEDKICIYCQQCWLNIQEDFKVSVFSNCYKHFEDKHCQLFSTFSIIRKILKYHNLLSGLKSRWSLRIYGVGNRKWIKYGCTQFTSEQTAYFEKTPEVSCLSVCRGTLCDLGKHSILTFNQAMPQCR